ncbi:hypothetical protein D3C84_306640 [compost metagenome]
MEEAHTVGELAGEAHLVGHHQHGQAVFGAEAADHVEHLAAELRVQRRGHFVEQHHFRPHRQGPGDGHSLLLASGQLRGIVVQLVAQADHVQQLDAALAGLGLAQAEHLDRCLHDVLQGAHVREQVEALEHHADLAAHSADVAFRRTHQLAAALDMGQGFAIDLDHALVDGFQGHQRPQQGGFARAAGADDRHLLVGLHLQIEVIEHGEAAVALVHALEAHHGAVQLWDSAAAGVAQGIGSKGHGGHGSSGVQRSAVRDSTCLTPKARTMLMVRKNRPTRVMGSR